MMNPTPTSHAAQAGIDLDSLTRYEPGRTTERMDMFPVPGGDYVRFADVESLLARHAAQAAPAADEREPLLKAALTAAENWSQKEHLHARDIGRGGPGMLAVVERAERNARAAIKALAQQAASPAPEAQAVDARELLNAEELAALRRFDETCQDGEGYDVTKVMMQRLAEVGVAQRRSGAYYQMTEIGMRILAASPAPETAQADEARELLKRAYRVLSCAVIVPIHDGEATLEAIGEYLKRPASSAHAQQDAAPAFWYDANAKVERMDLVNDAYQTHLLVCNQKFGDYTTPLYTAAPSAATGKAAAANAGGLPPLPDGDEYSATRMLANGELAPRYTAASMRDFGHACYIMGRESATSAGAAKDADRYRWMRTAINRDDTWPQDVANATTGDALEAAIDAAIAVSQKGDA